MASGGKSLSEDFEEFLQCAVCLETFTDPRLLSCGHSFCLGCLANLQSKANGTDIVCPNCRKSYRVPAEGLSHVPKDHRANSLLVIIKSHQDEKMIDTIKQRQEEIHSCSICKALGKSETAMTCCVTCKHTLCLTCTDDHNKNSRMTNHTVAKMDETKLPYLLCGRHPTEFVHDFCDDCKKSICQICTLKTHKGHKILELDLSKQITNLERLSISKRPMLSSDRISADNKELVIEHTINNISKLEEESKSEPRLLWKLPWNIMVIPKNQTRNGKTAKYLGFFIQCNTHDSSESWTCRAFATMRIMSRNDANPPFFRSVTHLFCPTENDWGFSHFMKWDELLNPSKGLVKDDSIKLEVTIIADAPTGVPIRDPLDDNISELTVKLVLEEQFYWHKGSDLFDPKTTLFREITLPKITTLRAFLCILSEKLCIPAPQIRPWPFAKRANKTFRAAVLDVENDLHKSIEQLSHGVNPWIVYLEVADQTKIVTTLPKFDVDRDVLLFLKKYDPEAKKPIYCGHVYIPITATIREFLLPILRSRGGFPENTPLLLYEEVKLNQIEEIKEFNKPLEDSIEELLDGDIIIFQKDETGIGLTSQVLNTPIAYFKALESATRL